MNWVARRECEYFASLILRVRYSASFWLFFCFSFSFRVFLSSGTQRKDRRFMLGCQWWGDVSDNIGDNACATCIITNSQVSGVAQMYLVVD